MEDFFLFFCFLLSVLCFFLLIVWREPTDEGAPTCQFFEKMTPARHKITYSDSLSMSDRSRLPVAPAAPSPARLPDSAETPKRARQISKKCIEFVKRCGALAGKEIPRTAWKAIGGRKLKFLYRPKVQFVVNYSSSNLVGRVNKWLGEKHRYKTDAPRKKVRINLLSRFRGSSIRQAISNEMKYKLTAEKELTDGRSMKVDITFIPRGAESCNVVLVLHGGRKHPPPTFEFFLLAESAVEFLSPTMRCKYTCPDGCSVPVGLLN